MALEMPAALLKEGLILLMLTSGPFIGGLLVLGVVIGLLQAMTQLHDPAVSFLPRVAMVIGVVVVGGGEILEELAAFFTRAVLQMAGG